MQRSRRYTFIHLALWMSLMITARSFQSMAIPSATTRDRRREGLQLEASTAVPTSSSRTHRYPPMVEYNPQPLLIKKNHPKKQRTGLLGTLFSRSSLNQSNELDEAAYQRRKDEWARKYTSVESLRNTFGSNRNEVWGDLDAPTARRLYKTLLPKALLDLYNLGVHAKDLAPLAYRARLAAKLYARERCQLPARVAANLYDGFRQWRRYGSFDTTGMSYQQVWEKYAAIILEECQGEEGLTDEDVTAKICLKILKSSCKTNEMVDRLVFSRHNDEEQSDLEQFTSTLENDVRKLLAPVNEQGASQQQLSAKKIRMLKKVVRMKRRLEGKPFKSENHNKLPWQNRQQPAARPSTTNRPRPWLDRDMGSRQ